MNITLFTILITVLSSVSAILTQAIKKAYDNAGKKYSANVLALINAVLVGCGGTSVAYGLLGIAFSLTNVICIFLMGLVVWIGSMIGYDKVKQLVEQLAVIK